MAIVQISKIQVRRGKKNQAESVPQLASGEFGWAVDTRELFIGNGSIAEGAPAVGNTKVLTEYDNLTELLRLKTQFKKSDPTYQTGLTVNDPVVRDLQDRLDDNVSVFDFGVKIDSDATVKLQHAINQLYPITNPRVNSRNVVLKFPAGVYELSNSIVIPPYVTLIGAGKGRTIIKQRSAKSIFVSDAAGANHSVISGFTFETDSATQPLVNLINTSDTIFDQIEFIGANGSTSSVGLQLQNSSKNYFSNCAFTGFYKAVVGSGSVENNTLADSVIENCAYGVYFTGTGTNHNIVEHTIFDNIANEGIFVEKGYGNLSIRNSYKAVGYSSNSSVIHFGVPGNISDLDEFDRFILQPDTYVGEFSGYAVGNYKLVPSITFTSAGTLFRLGATINQNVTYLIHYSYTNGSESKYGTFEIDIDESDEPGILRSSDEYTTKMNDSPFKLQAIMDDDRSIKVVCQTAPALPGNFSYWVEIKLS